MVEEGVLARPTLDIARGRALPDPKKGHEVITSADKQILLAENWTETNTLLGSTGPHYFIHYKSWKQAYVFIPLPTLLIRLPIAMPLLLRDCAWCRPASPPILDGRSFSG
jgi:hypothetical protein